MMLGWRRARRSEPAELQITAFMNLMVVLVPFLLITAVFSQMAVLELNLPDPQAERPDDAPPERALTVVIRADELLVLDAGGPIQRLPATDGRHDLAALTELLVRVKQRIPSEQRITLLLEPDIPYEVMIRAMDAVRTWPGSRRELFPQIAVGDAPPREAAQ